MEVAGKFSDNADVKNIESTLPVPSMAIKGNCSYISEFVEWEEGQFLSQST